MLLKEQISQKYVLYAQHLATCTSVSHVLFTLKVVEDTNHGAPAKDKDNCF